MLGPGEVTFYLLEKLALPVDKCNMDKRGWGWGPKSNSWTVNT